MKNKKIQQVFFTVLGLLFSNLIWANEDITSPKSPDGLLEWIFHNIVLIMGGMVIVGAFLAVLYLFEKLFELQKIRLLQEHGLAAMEEVKLMNKESWWSRFYKDMTKAVPIEKEKDVLLNHDYDGIKELDNVLPPWWVAMFYVTIIMSFIYIGYWHFSDSGYSSSEEYEMEMEMAEDAVKAYLASQADMVDETNVELLIDKSQISLGESIFKTKCTPCHGQLGEGNSIGPNLTDKYWLNGGSIKDVFKTIKYGVPENGMISWKSQLRPSDMQKVASFILSLQGTNPPNAKAPQGEIYEPEEKINEGEKIGMK